MFNPDTDFLFPARAIPDLQGLSGPEWDNLVKRAQETSESDPEHLAFVLLMVHLNGCTNCNADSFKAMRGCIACSVQTLERFTGTDEDLLKRYQKAATQIDEYNKVK